MSPSELMFVTATMYKVASLIVGLIIVFFGYKLFLAGVFAQQGDFQANFGDNKLFLKKAAPGTFFALFGSIVIALTIVTGISIEDINNKTLSSNPNESIKLPEVAPW